MEYSLDITLFPLIYFNELSSGDLCPGLPSCQVYDSISFTLQEYETKKHAVMRILRHFQNI